MRLWGLRATLALCALCAVAVYAIIQIHEHANIVDIEVLPQPGAPASAEPTRIGPRDVPGRDVREHVDFYPHGGPGCAPPKRSGPRVSVGFRHKVEIGTRSELCFGGYIHDRDVSLTIGGRGVRIVKQRIPPLPWSWNVPPRLAPGWYVARAVQGPRVASYRFKLVNARPPFARVRYSRKNPNAYEIVVGGLASSRHAPVHIYRAVSSISVPFDYFTTVMVPTNKFGNGSISLRGTGGSTFTCYGLVPGFKGVVLGDQFCFGKADYD